MTAIALADTLTMLRRSLRRMRRYPSLTLFVAGIPVVLMLLFVYVFGGTLGAGLGRSATGPLGGTTAASVDRAAYLAYVVPGILLIGVAGAGQGTAISVAMDMTAGIIARFRTMAIGHPSVLAGDILGSVVQTRWPPRSSSWSRSRSGSRPPPGPSSGWVPPACWRSPPSR